jgi:hypothetical protein
MRNKSVPACWLLWIASVASTWLLATTGAPAQDNALCTSTSGCSMSAASPAFLDASVAGGWPTHSNATLNHI